MRIFLGGATGAIGGDLRHFDRTFAVTNELRTKGTDNLVAAVAATTAGAAPRRAT